MIGMESERTENHCWGESGLYGVVFSETPLGLGMLGIKT